VLAVVFFQSTEHSVTINEPANGPRGDFQISSSRLKMYLLKRKDGGLMPDRYCHRKFKFRNSLLQNAHHLNLNTHHPNLNLRKVSPQI
jgi:hypothetical protein